MNHRALQRTLFRMQLDPEYGRSLMAGEDAAVMLCEMLEKAGKITSLSE